MSVYSNLLHLMQEPLPQFETLLYAVDREAKDKHGHITEGDAIAIITINRPDKHNALNQTVLRDLSAAISVAKFDDEIRGVIITGAGSRSFVAGADIAEFKGIRPLEAQALATKGQGVFNQIEQLHKPVIAAVNGYALGGGCELSMACHLRIAAENAVFGQPEVNLGLIPGYGGTQRLPRLVGRGIATEMILSGKTVDAQRAYEIGLVNEVSPAEGLLESAKRMMRSMTSRAPLAVHLGLQALHKSDLPLTIGLEFEAALFGQIVSSEDFIEGVDAFLQKRPPHFKGK